VKTKLRNVDVSSIGSNEAAISNLIEYLFENDVITQGQYINAQRASTELFEILMPTGVPINTAAPSAPDTAAFKVGDRVMNTRHNMVGTVINVPTLNWLRVQTEWLYDGEFDWRANEVALYYDQPQPAAPWPTPVVKQSSSDRYETVGSDGWYAAKRRAETEAKHSDHFTAHYIDAPQPSPTADYVYPDHPDLLATMHALQVLDEAELCSLCGKVHRPLSEPCDQPQPDTAAERRAVTDYMIEAADSLQRDYDKALDQERYDEMFPHPSPAPVSAAAKLSKAQREVLGFLANNEKNNISDWGVAYCDLIAIPVYNAHWTTIKALLKKRLIEEWPRVEYRNRITDAGRQVLK